MKKLFAFALILALGSSSVFAQALIGGRGAGMGGTGVASSTGLDSAYYNPACLMRSNNMVADVDIALGAGYTAYDQLSNALSKANDPAKFLLDNFGTNLSFNGDLSGVIGITSHKIGLSVIPMGGAIVNKPANSLGGTVNANAIYAGVLTLGTTFSVPYLPAALDVGVNLKSLNAISGNASVAAAIGATTGTGTQIYGTGTGMGFDIGVLTTFDVPMVSSLSVGAVMRDISSSYVMKSTTRTATLNQLTNTVTLGPETTLPDQTVNLDSSTAIGAAATVPGIGIGLAADLEITKNNGTNTHFGLEYPLAMNTIFLRAGMASGQNLQLTTYGVEFNFRVLTLAINSATDGKNTGLTRTYADIKIGI